MMPFPGRVDRLSLGYLTFPLLAGKLDIFSIGFCLEREKWFRGKSSRESSEWLKSRPGNNKGIKYHRWLYILSYTARTIT